MRWTLDVLERAYKLASQVLSHLREDNEKKNTTGHASNSRNDVSAKFAGHHHGYFT
jgi:hypothetical protein